MLRNPSGLDSHPSIFDTFIVTEGIGHTNNGLQRSYLESSKKIALMVEPSIDKESLRALTPTPTGKSAGRERTSNSPAHIAPAANEFLFLSTRQSKHTPLNFVPAPDSVSPSMGDAREGAQNSSPMPGHSEAGSTRRRPRSRSHHTHGSHFTSPTTPHSVSPPPGPSDNTYGAAFPGSVSCYPSVSMSYGHRGGYVPHTYTMPNQHSIVIGHSPPPFSGLPFRHPGVSEGGVLPRGLHSYQPMLQPHVPIYYHRPSPDDASPPHTQLEGNPSSPPYPPHQVATPPGSGPLASTPTGPINIHPPPYPGTNPFQYQSPLSTPRYPYPQQSFPASPSIYHPYTSRQNYGPSDDQGTWYYLPHPPQRYGEGGPVPYQGHYPISYHSVGHYNTDTTYIVPSTSASGLEGQGPGVYPMSESREPVDGVETTTSDYRSPSAPPKLPGFGLSSVNNPDSGGSNDDDGAAGSSGGGRHQNLIERKAYHPNPPPHRSEWVMWVGNVPSDATHDELWKFFNKLPAGAGEGDSSSATSGSTSGARTATGVGTSSRRGQIFGSGVMSIFLISRSSCVFVNYQTEEHLNRAIEMFNGRQIRPHDSRCLRLVCRVRRRDDDLKAGVGGQRGQGLHTRWVKEKKLKERGQGSSLDASTPASDDYRSQVSSRRAGSPSVSSLTSHISSLSLSSEEGKTTHPSHRSSSGSFASSSSSFLASFFPKRYFILKSLTQYDLDLSVQQGLWATQKHNEGILDQAYRTSKEVYLIFGVNKSGEFYGYARMTGPVQHGERNVPWASRSREGSEPARSVVFDGLEQPNSASGSASRVSYFGSSTDVPVLANSPMPMSALGGQSDVKTPYASKIQNSAPAELGQPHRQLTIHAPDTRAATMLDQGPKFELDPEAPLRAMRSSTEGTGLGSFTLRTVEEEEKEKVEDGIGEGSESRKEFISREDVWGDCFQVEWLCTEKLPFHWTKHLRNPWNHDREVKVSRDGTELEPSVGQMLLDAWDTMRAEGGQIPSNIPGSSRSSRPGGYARRHTGGGKQAVENTTEGPRS